MGTFRSHWKLWRRSPCTSKEARFCLQVCSACHHGSRSRCGWHAGERKSLPLLVLPAAEHGAQLICWLPRRRTAAEAGSRDESPHRGLPHTTPCAMSFQQTGQFYGQVSGQASRTPRASLASPSQITSSPSHLPVTTRAWRVLSTGYHECVPSLRGPTGSRGESLRDSQHNYPIAWIDAETNELE